MKHCINRFINSIIPALVLTFIGGINYGQESTPDNKPGKIYGTIYSNIHTEINKGDNESGFEIKRAYFGYRRDLDENFTANVKLDIGSPEDLSEYSLIRRYAYFKNAWLGYKKEKLSMYFGIIDLLYFKIHEKYWAHRYVEKAFADNYPFGNSADLGFQVKYAWAAWIETDITFSNGEGYTKLQTDNTYKTAFGVTFKPGYNIVTRLYYDYSSKSLQMSTASAFIGYELENKVIGGFEYHYRTNDNFTDQHDMYGYSGYISWYFYKKWQIFGRFDKVSSNIIGNEDTPWNLASDGSKIIGGIEFSPMEKVKLSLNYQDWYPYAKNIDNEQFIYLNTEVKF